MKRKILIALLAMGTVGGYALGFASVRHHCHARHDAFERHVAELCVNAAKSSENATQVAAPASEAP